MDWTDEDHKKAKMAFVGSGCLLGDGSIAEMIR